jgi:hypothetical protein
MVRGSERSGRGSRPPERGMGVELSREIQEASFEVDVKIHEAAKGKRMLVDDRTPGSHRKGLGRENPVLCRG